MSHERADARQPERQDPERPEASSDADREPVAEPATAQAPGDRKRRRPASLVDLYTLPKAAVPELLAALLKRDAWITSSTDQEEALGLLAERDPDLAKTRTLAQHVATGHDGRFAASFESFLVGAVAPVLDGTPGWPPQDGSDGPTLFAALLKTHGAALREKEPARRLFNAVMIAQSVLMARYGLDIQDAVPLLSHTLGPPVALRRDRRNPRLVRLRSVGDTRLTVDALRTWLDVLTPWIERAVSAEQRAEGAKSDAHRLEGVIADLEAELAALRANLVEANDQIGTLRQEIHELSVQRRGATLARQHEGSQLRGSMAGFLEDDVGALLSSVREGLELDPPRVPFSLERLEDAEHAIQDKVRW
ncbi:MAG TPA: hypothetical protein PKB03_05495, partial [Baekduia sp.]|nr:hypothetical protein [Baekduia sp.]